MRGQNGQRSVGEKDACSVTRVAILTKNNFKKLGGGGRLSGRLPASRVSLAKGVPHDAKIIEPEGVQRYHWERPFKEFMTREFFVLHLRR